MRRCRKISTFSLNQQLPRCRSGRHTWFDQEDANRCCNPDYRRDLRASETYARHVWVGSRDGSRRAADHLEGGARWTSNWSGQRSRSLAEMRARSRAGAAS